MLARLILIASLPSLAACSSFSGRPAPAEIVPLKPDTAKVSEALKAPCSSPTEIPAGELPYDDAIVKWSEDRSSLDECRIRHKALSQSVDVLEAK